MAQRGKLATTVGAALVAIALLLAVLLPREPRYKGLTMGEWLHVNSSQSNEALQILGTNNLPLLLRRVAYDRDKGVLFRLYRLTGFTRIIEMANRRNVLSDQARMVLQNLGPKATSAIPELERIVDHGGPFASQRAFWILNSLGDEGLTVIAARITSTNLATRRYAAGLLALHPESSIARSALTNLLNDPDPQVRGLALSGLNTPR